MTTNSSCPLEVVIVVGGEGGGRVVGGGGRLFEAGRLLNFPPNVQQDGRIFEAGANLRLGV